jgi:TonB family protein
MQRLNPPRDDSPELVDYSDTISRDPSRYGAPPLAVDSTPREVPSNVPPDVPPDGTYELSAVEVQPELLNRSEIARQMARNYPPLLRDAGVTGTATIRLRIREDGTVDDESVTVESTTHEQFGEAARRVAERMRFKPARVRGKPVRVWVTLPVTFQLEG